MAKTDERLRRFVARILDEDLPPGCFMGDTATAVDLHGGSVVDTLHALYGRLASQVHQCIEAAIADSELDSATSTMPVLQFVLGQVSALAAISRTGPTQTQLDTVVDYMVAGLPWANTTG